MTTKETTRNTTISDRVMADRVACVREFARLRIPHCIRQETEHAGENTAVGAIAERGALQAVLRILNGEEL